MARVISGENRSLNDEFGEFYDPDRVFTHRQELAEATKRKDVQRKKLITDINNEVGRCVDIPPEIMEERARYRENYLLAHPVIFPQSTGMKPFGSVQLESVTRMQYVIQHGGKLIQAEPRGFGKTSRGANNLLMGVLQGDIKYGLILANSLEKAMDIIEGIQTELMDNDQLYRLYPNVIKCFRRLENKSIKAKTQTMDGVHTFINMTGDLIRFPVIEGEPSSGALIVVRSKDNVRGLNKKVRHGIDSGKVIRPDFALLDDIQTDEEARSATSVKNIIQTIKRSILFSGSQFRKISVVMTVTPIQYGDVATHFILNEPFWEVVLYKMVKTMPINLQMWLEDYAQILLNFDKRIQGDKQRAQMRAKDYVVEHYDVLHAGAEVAWDYAYEWNREPEVEVSALQHAMNFLIEEGQEAFDMECQCSVEWKNDESEAVKCSIKDISEKIHRTPKKIIPVECKHIVTHIDVHDNILTSVTCASPDLFQPHIIDYGTYPEQPGVMFDMSRLFRTIPESYPEYEENEFRLYMAIKDYINKIGGTEYQREDGIMLSNHLISADIGYLQEVVRRACRDSNFRNITLGARGLSTVAKEKPFEEKSQPLENTKHYHAYTQPSPDRVTFEIMADTNFFKTMVHTGFKTRRGMPGCITLYHPERMGEHMLLATHCNNEEAREDYYPKEDRRTIVWGDRAGRDNEYFDNIVGCIALLFKRGCTMKDVKIRRTYNMQDFINGQTPEP